MKAFIKHDIPGRIRVHFDRPRFSFREADTLQYYLQGIESVEKAVVYERTADAVIRYNCCRDEMLRIIREYDPEKTVVPENYYESSSRDLNAQYYEDIVSSIVRHFAKKLFLPLPIRTALTCIKSARYAWRGLKTIPEKRLKVELLDAAAIGVSLLVGDYPTASSVMFLLDIGDTMEEWTHKKCTTDLARQMSLNISQVWKVENGQEIQSDAELIKTGDIVVVRMGKIIPFDRVIESGDALINQ
ncbi:MAG: heavy metal translocating P-type ATPase, partial [Lachnospiraceae bacterium]|nr:heavy metal translocating P-type ATPase [Lachnospiraceae bacterium]